MYCIESSHQIQFIVTLCRSGQSDSLLICIHYRWLLWSGLAMEFSVPGRWSICDSMNSDHSHCPSLSVGSESWSEVTPIIHCPSLSVGSESWSEVTPITATSPPCRLALKVGQKSLRSQPLPLLVGWLWKWVRSHSDHPLPLLVGWLWKLVRSHSDHSHFPSLSVGSESWSEVTPITATAPPCRLALKVGQKSPARLSSAQTF